MIQSLLSVPPPLRRFLASSAGRQAGITPAGAYIGSDPGTRQLGSGGGTAALLEAAWRDSGRRRPDLWEWIASRQSVLLHAGGESRRLPAYAPLGKAFLPIPPLGVGIPRRFDQSLADFQLPTYRQVLQEAGPKAAVMVASGDVWLELDALHIPPVEADITGIGMRVTPEIARHFGVFFVAKSGPTAARRSQPVAFFLQKPSPAEIYRQLSRYDFFVDTGLWLLSARAVQLLFRRCGWDARRNRFATPDGHPRFLDLYTEFGGALGAQSKVPPALQRLGWSQLTTAVVPLDDARFFHLGSSRQLFDSFDQLLRTPGSEPRVLRSATSLQNIAPPSSLPVWLDGVAAREPLQLDGLNLVTGKPAAAGALRLGIGQCLDIVPTGSRDFIVRPYALDDTLRGQAVSNAALICGQPAAEWLKRRGLFSTTASAIDVFALPLYPIIRESDINQALVDWFFALEPEPKITRALSAHRRVAAAQIPALTDFRRYFAQRAANHVASLREEFESCLHSGDTRVFSQDFAAIARYAAAKEGAALRRWLLRHHATLLPRLSRPEHQSRLLTLVAELNRGGARQRASREAYQRLQSAIVSSTHLMPAKPRLALKEDQIVWSRSPVRLDLAGGWTDTPPYCLEYGGAVVNVAVLLNGQPPIQVFVRPLADPVISLRSIDLGSHEIVSTDAGLAGFRDPRSGFGLPKAALALAGFHPDFAVGKSHTLRQRLAAFGGGLEISLLSAVPKGSGLGTSSILAATLLGALNRACHLGWDEVALYNRVLGVEQLLTTGGGWQDQAGALFRGVKLIQTAPGPAQTPSVRFLPAHLFDPSHANRTLLLYYTGITRLAKGILKEIVEDMFLGRFETLQTMNLIRANALELFNVLQQGDAAALHRCIGRSWDLNKRLDPGTSSPAIEKLLQSCGPDLAAAKLLGAGGGGYMLLCTKSPEGAQRIREKLEANPPNRRARFIDFQVAERGLEVTVS